MNADTVFSTASMAAAAGWLALLASPFAPRLADHIAAIAIPGLLAIVYSGLVLAYWSSAQGGFDTLDHVALLFRSRELLLAGWIHYLAFDLFVGAWIVRAARGASIPFWIVVPCLALTFTFGPAGLLAFVALRAIRSPLTSIAAA